MADLILHHFTGSPFAEKVRIALGIKQLAWKSVIIPVLMPKPDLMPLTGGYRRTPVLQVGADIYCDTQLILLELEKRAPTPPLLPVGREGEARGLAMWVDHNIPWAAGDVVLGLRADQLPEAFKKDRGEFTGRSFDAGALKAAVPAALDKAYVHFAIAEQILRDGRPYLLGAAPSIADCALYNPVWFLQSRLGQGSCAPAPLDRLPKVVAWWERMKAFGNGKPAELASAEALDIAKGATPEPTEVDQSNPSGLKAGHKISIVPDDTGKVPVSGTLVGLTPERVSITRSDPRVGDVVVHFPRAGFVIAQL